MLQLDICQRESVDEPPESFASESRRSIRARDVAPERLTSDPGQSALSIKDFGTGRTALTLSNDRWTILDTFRSRARITSWRGMLVVLEIVWE